MNCDSDSDSFRMNATRKMLVAICFPYFDHIFVVPVYTMFTILYPCFSLLQAVEEGWANYYNVHNVSDFFETYVYFPLAELSHGKLHSSCKYCAGLKIGPKRFSGQ